MVVLTRRQVAKAQARRIRFAAYVLAFTGQPYLVPHPYVRSYRLAWASATATRSTLVAKHRS